MTHLNAWWWVDAHVTLRHFNDIYITRISWLRPGRRPLRASSLGFWTTRITPFSFLAVGRTTILAVVVATVLAFAAVVSVFLSGSSSRGPTICATIDNCSFVSFFG